MCVCVCVLAFQDYFIGGIVYLQQEACNVWLSVIFASVSLAWIPVSRLMYQRVNPCIVLLDIVVGYSRFHKQEGFS